MYILLKESFLPPPLYPKKYRRSKSWVVEQIIICRVPFEAKSMAELRGKVMNGTVKPITPGKYSMDLVLLMQSLLNLTPSKRPSLDKILSSSAIQKRLGTGNSSFSSESHVIGTIKVISLIKIEECIVVFTTIFAELSQVRQTISIKPSQHHKWGFLSCFADSMIRGYWPLSILTIFCPADVSLFSSATVFVHAENEAIHLLIFLRQANKIFEQSV